MKGTVDEEDLRGEQLRGWLESETDLGGARMDPVFGDASARRYFRVFRDERSWILMDAPPDSEDCRPFVEIAGFLRGGGVCVPKIHALDLEKGFMVLEDFGSLHLEDALDGGYDREGLYDLALEELMLLARMPATVTDRLPPYDRDWLQMELDIFHDWFLHGNTVERERDRRAFHGMTMGLIGGILEQPTVFVHRDFHCRNLLLLQDGGLGVIDFQGAFSGPLTYDLVSLLRDCYQDNSRKWVEKRALLQKARLEDVLSMEWPDEQFMKWMDWTGLQRHLKVLGLFRRLQLRDNKDRYLQYLPRVKGYAEDVLCRHAELSKLRAFIESFETWKEVGK